MLNNNTESKNYKLLFLLISLFVFSSYTYAEDKIHDSVITVAIKSKLLLEKDIPSRDIKVTTQNGRVYLEGQVDTTLQSNRVVEIVFSTEGVESIDISKFNVNQQPVSFIEDSNTTAKAYGKVRFLLDKKTISENCSIRIETFDQNVHIWGHVGNKSDIQAIESFVSRIPEVKKVHTKLKVQKK